jgi:hypothetical protein
MAPPKTRGGQQQQPSGAQKRKAAEWPPLPPQPGAALSSRGRGQRVQAAAGDAGAVNGEAVNEEGAQETASFSPRLAPNRFVECPTCQKDVHRVLLDAHMEACQPAYLDWLPDELRRQVLVGPHR